MTLRVIMLQETTCTRLHLYLLPIYISMHTAQCIYLFATRTATLAHHPFPMRNGTSATEITFMSALAEAPMPFDHLEVVEIISGPLLKSTLPNPQPLATAMFRSTLLRRAVATAKATTSTHVRAPLARPVLRPFSSSAGELAKNTPVPVSPLLFGEEVRGWNSRGADVWVGRDR